MRASVERALLVLIIAGGMGVILLRQDSQPPSERVKSGEPSKQASLKWELEDGSGAAEPSTPIRSGNFQSLSIGTESRGPGIRSSPRPGSQGDPLEGFEFKGITDIAGESLALIEDRKTRAGSFVKVGRYFRGMKVEGIDLAGVTLRVGVATRRLGGDVPLPRVSLLVQPAPGQTPLEPENNPLYIAREHPEGHVAMMKRLHEEGKMNDRELFDRLWTTREKMEAERKAEAEMWGKLTPDDIKRMQKSGL